MMTAPSQGLVSATSLSPVCHMRGISDLNRLLAIWMVIWLTALRILDLLKEVWEEQPLYSQNVLQQVLEVHECLKWLGQFVKENLLWAQWIQTQHYNKRTQENIFQSGDCVLLLLSSLESKLLVKWQGPYKVVQWVGKVYYEILCLGKKKKHQNFHLNMLKSWWAKESLFIDPGDLLGIWATRYKSQEVLKMCQ